MPGDVQVGPVEAPTPVGAPTRANRLASVQKGLADIRAEASTTPADAPKLVVETKPAPVEAKVETKPTDEKIADVIGDKPLELDEKPDPRVTKGLDAVEKQRKRLLEEQRAAKAEMELERAEIARLRAEANAKTSGFEELKKLKAIEALEKLGYSSEEDFDVVAREAYARTKAGKADPRTKTAAEQAGASRDLMKRFEALEARNEELQKKLDDVGGEFSKRDAKAANEVFVSKWQDDAVKAIPSDKPTLIAKLHEKSPVRAREILLQIGSILEKQNDNETPTHAEVIAAYEKMRRAELEDSGVDVDALLAPRKATSTVSKTLDVTTTGGTRPSLSASTRADKLSAVTAGLRQITKNDE